MSSEFIDKHTTKVAIYCRISTDKQELENQLAQLRDYAKKSNWNIYQEYTEIISGKENKRTQFDALFRDAHKKLFDGVLFWSLDRFSRSGTLFTLQKLKELDNLGIFWHSYQDPYISTAGEWKDVIISIMSTLAKIERERISVRTKAGLQRVKSQGKQLGRKPIPEEAKKQVIAFLQQNSLSYRQISQKVTYKTKFGKVHHVSPAMITQIKKNCLEKECEK
jgi:DNA invertase Pin-like site-specific DNA recombinase